MGTNKKNGFTIVELLLVVVVISILAAVTLVAYNGVTQKAVAASLQSDLSGASNQLKMFQVNNSNYPTTISSDCNSQPTTATNLCLTPSPGNTFGGYTVNNSVIPKTFSLTATHTASNVSYVITNDTPPTIVAGQPAQSSGWKQITASGYATCAISYDDKAYCWGYNNQGQVGDGTTSRRTSPTQVSTSGVLNGKTIKVISTGEQYETCAVASDNQAYCWGGNYSGGLGAGLAYPGTARSTTPIAILTSGVLNGKTIKTISVGGWNNNCVIASDDQAYCWGYNAGGGLGNNSTLASNAPVAVYTSGALSGKTIKYIGAGSNAACAVASDNKDYCWGYIVGSSVPVAQLNSISTTATNPLSTGFYHTCYIDADNKAYCYGDNSTGQFGDGTTNSSATPVAVSTTGVLNGKTIKAISSGAQSTCAIASDDKAYCWGDNTNGQLGNNSTSQSLVPVAVDTNGVLSGKTILSIAVGADTHACVIASDFNAYCWGLNSQGMLGNGTQNNSLVPVLAGSPS